MRPENPPDPGDVKSVLDAAWRMVCAERPSLFDYLAGGDWRVERALCFRLGLALSELIARRRMWWRPPWSRVVVDSELHRAADGKKIGDSIKAPDIIVHERMTDSNLLVAEFKLRKEPNAQDRAKLEWLGKNRSYQYAWAVRLDQDQDPTIVCAFGSVDVYFAG